MEEQTLENIRRFQKAQTKMIQTEIINKTEKPNSISFRYGSVGAEMKIYFSDVVDLQQQLEALNNSSEAFGELITRIKLKLGKNETGAYR